ncbi:putative gastrointestinal growth factor xP4 [Ambystoma mexicanum]|uniref:putative gastrointestinal growth factor xP4 n=1 Tax=Ambystoma mexicanum TaxID=8296 RepID=UPI0037E8FEFC
MECGFAGISQNECERQECCFDKSISAAIWCFRPFEKAYKGSNQCSIDPKAREDCGYPGIAPQACKDKNCCFDDSITGVKWCFYPLPKVQKSAYQCYAINPKDRTDCGYSGITPGECMKMNCCFDTGIAGVKFCFYPLATKNDVYTLRCMQEDD